MLLVAKLLDYTRYLAIPSYWTDVDEVVKLPMNWKEISDEELHKTNVSSLDFDEQAIVVVSEHGDDSKALFKVIALNRLDSLDNLGQTSKRARMSTRNSDYMYSLDDVVDLDKENIPQKLCAGRGKLPSQRDYEDLAQLIPEKSVDMQRIFSMLDVISQKLTDVQTVMQSFGARSHIIENNQTTLDTRMKIITNCVKRININEISRSDNVVANESRLYELPCKTLQSSGASSSP